MNNFDLIDLLKIQRCRSINLNLNSFYDYTCAKLDLIMDNWMAWICLIWYPNVMVCSFCLPQINMCKMPPNQQWRSFKKTYKKWAYQRVWPLLHQHFVKVLTMCKVASLTSSLSYFFNCCLFHFSHVSFVLCVLCLSFIFFHSSFVFHYLVGCSWIFLKIVQVRWRWSIHFDLAFVDYIASVLGCNLNLFFSNNFWHLMHFQCFQCSICDVSDFDIKCIFFDEFLIFCCFGWNPILCINP